MKRRIIIPARYASTRLPGKMLLNIAGKPMLQHVYERACSAGFDSVLIATDDARIQSAASAFGAEVCLTASTHLSGTDRIAEAFQLMDYADEDVIVGLQGDEPLMPIENLVQVANNLAVQEVAVVATLCSPIHDAARIFDPNTVKVVRDAQNFALYFSRAPIPWVRDSFPNLPSSLEVHRHLAHVGLYCYRGAFLAQYTQLPPSELEQLEALEQLRILSQGLKIHVDVAAKPTPAGVDTPQCLQRVRELMEKA